MLAQERELFELDHCQAGRHLAAAWKLPNQFLDIISRHHYAPESGDGFGLLAVIDLACRMADTLGFAAAPACKCCSYQKLASQFPARLRERLPREPEELAFQIATKINSIESVY